MIMRVFHLHVIIILHIEVIHQTIGIVIVVEDQIVIMITVKVMVRMTMNIIHMEIVAKMIDTSKQIHQIDVIHSNHIKKKFSFREENQVVVDVEGKLNFNSFDIICLIFFLIHFPLCSYFYRRTSSAPIVKRIDNYGPPNAKSPFGASDDKIEKKSEVKTIEDISTVNKKPESIDGNTAHSIDSSCKC